MKYYILFFAVSCLLFGAACGDDATTPTDVSDLKQARNRWDQAGFDSYEITQRRNCFCILGGRPVRLRVWRDSLQRGEDLTDSTAIPAEQLGWYMSIDQLFDYIEAIDPGKVASVEVRFDSTFGFPTYFFVDHDIQIADDEMGFECSDLHPLR